MKPRALVCALPLLACALAFFACGDDDATTTVPPVSEAGAVDAKPGGPTTKPIGDDDDDDDTNDEDAGKKPDASTPKDAGKDADADADAEPPPPPAKKRVFVTKAKFTGDLKTAGGGVNGADGADKICQAAADGASLGGGGWTAWVSVTGKSAIDRIPNDGPWYLVDKTTLVFSKKSAIASAPLHAIDKNETGTSLVAGSGGPLQNRVWTGTLNSGVEVAGSNCVDWTDATATTKGVAGAYREVAGWSRNAPPGPATDNCDTPWPIYCFEQ